MQLELIYNSIDGLVRKSSLSLVDLAGSERIAKTGAEGQRLKEAQKINQSLTTLGMVIMALTTSGSKHIPFRNSKLTLILKDSLGGSSKTTLLCTASRLKKHSEESIQTLYFASRAKIIKNSTKKNVILNAGELQYIANGLKKEVMILRGIMKKNGFMWRNIEDKKILGFIGNDEFLKDDGNYNTGNDESENNNLEDKNEKKEEKKSNVVKKTIVNCNDVEIKNMKINMDTEKVLLQRIIDELNERIDNKDKENINLKKKIEEYIFQIGQCENLYQEKKALENELEEQKRIFNQKDGEFNKINSELSLIEIENENLNNQIQEQENSLNNNIEQYGNEIQILKKENSDKNNLLKELEIKVKNEEENRKKIEIDFKKKEENWNNELKLFKENLEKLNMLLNDKIIEKNILNENEKKHSEKLLSLREINSQTISENEKLKRNLLNISIENNNEINKMKNNYDKIIDEDKISLNIKETKIKDYETQIKFINSQIESQDERLEIINKIAENQKKEIEENSKKANIDNEKLINENKELNLSMKNQEEQISKLEKENKQLNQKLLELEKQMQIIKQTKSNVQNKNQISNNLITNNNTHNSKKTENTQISKNAFGIVLKKINKNENSIDFLGEAIKQAKSNSKLLLELNKNRLDLLSDLKQNIDYDSPKTVSSVSLNEEDIPQLDFANGNNEEIFKKAEDILIEKELQRKVQKELRMSTMNK
jgi:kinesin family protein 5